MAGVLQGSTLYAGSVSQALIYEIDNGTGLEWAEHVRTEILVDAKPRQLTRGAHAGDPITENVSNPRLGTDFPIGDTVTIDGRQLSIADLMVPDFFTARDWLDTFPEFQPSGLSIDLQLNPKILQVIFNRIMNATKTQINKIHFAGDTAAGGGNPLRFYDGFEKLINADADATQVGTPVVLTSSNILDEIFELRDAIDPRLRSHPSLKIFISYADGDLFDKAARETQTQATINSITGQRSISQASGQIIPIIPIENIAKDFVFATVADKSEGSNLVQGVWMEKDIDTLKLYREVEVDETWAILLRFQCGVQHVSGLDIWYKDNI